ncbi:hypothetical protein CFC21_073257 [Triticum aestivum]|uniref:DUF4220 domain-containing protein n=2 Tax=Triticum aestivum TaxID=4565 RepID=A0A3B6LR09_WHEAT|nr:uncharacterized protein LOC119311599 [Triticum dicoccoides]XP_044390162.1 uncharacterized protein LOC123113098 [Triticum aestivum]XP_044390163.1 uncharacterized protein LOC123113098 [Triticum aestivum]KAF7067359.1 hypothetical protein CFC21_073257 [Triticum aestivum]
MGLSSAVDWWEEWQLRILVLGSLFVQYLLLCSAPFRKFAIPSWYRSIIWLAYLGSDSVAIYALATLFNRQRRQDYGSANSNSILEVVWAPVLLMHLGGQDVISAYNIEDNELWTRHVLTAVSQVTVAIYVFCKSWPGTGGDTRLLLASICFFVSGIVKCIEKPWALKRASINSLVSSSDTAARMGSMFGKTISLEEYVQEARNFVQSQVEGHAVDLEHNHVPQAQAETDAVESNHHRQAHGKGNAADLDPNHILRAQGEANGKRRLIQKRENNRKYDVQIRKIFVDLASSYTDRLDILKSFWVLDEKRACAFLRKGLLNTFDLLYTKQKVNTSMEIIRKIQEARKADITFQNFFTWCFLALALYLPFAAIGLFHKSHRGTYNVNDVKVTYALFCCTAAMQFFAMYFHMLAAALSGLLISSGMVAQYSLLNFFIRNERHSKKMCVLSSFNCKDFLDQRWCMKSCSSSFGITELVLGYVKCCWEKDIVDAASYRKFSDQRGQWTIQRSGCDKDQEWGLNRSFDESVLLWHIATDLCFYQKGDTSASRGDATKCREISNYMVYLLFVHPEMLLPGTRRNLFKAANAELEEIFKDDKPLLKAILKGGKPSLMEIPKRKGPLPEQIERRLVDSIIAKVQPTKYSKQVEHTYLAPAAQEGFIHEARKISELLLSLGDEKMWKVIKGVWVEMLCFSASRCRGFLHAKSLGTGGELLTYVWLLLSHMGMETLPERAQRRELSSEGGNMGAAPFTSRVSIPTGEDMV